MGCAVSALYIDTVGGIQDWPRSALISYNGGCSSGDSSVVEMLRIYHKNKFISIKRIKKWNYTELLLVECNDYNLSLTFILFIQKIIMMVDDIFLKK